MSVLLEDIGEPHSRTIHNISIALVEKRIGLVCFQESAYISGDDKSMVGPSAAHVEFLKCMKWRVIPVRVAHFSRLATLKKKKEFLAQSIASCELE